MPLWSGKVCRLSPGQGKEKKRQEKAGVGRGEGKACGKAEAEERKSWWGWSKCKKMPEGAEGQEGQVCRRLWWPSWPTLPTALSRSSWLARDGEGRCCAGSGKNSVAAPQGLPREPGCVAQGHCASLRAHRPRRALGVGIRRRRHAVVNASNDSLLWATNSSS